MEKDPYQLLMAYAFRLLSKKTYTEGEILKKFSSKGKRLKLSEDESAPAGKKVLERLKELNYVNDEKFIDDYFEYRLNNKPQGKFGFVNEMKKRRISFEIARQQWEKRNIDEKSLAMRLVSKKLRILHKLPPPKKKKKIMAALASRGFSPDIVWEILGELD